MKIDRCVREKEIVCGLVSQSDTMIDETGRPEINLDSITHNFLHFDVGLTLRFSYDRKGKYFGQ